MKQVVVTGVGAVSACGVGVSKLWRATVDGTSAVRGVVFPRIPKQSVPHAAMISEADIGTISEAAKPRFQDRVSILALAAAREAIGQAGLSEADFGARCGIVIGSGFGGAETVDVNYHRFTEDKASRIDPMTVAKIMANAPASWIAMNWGITGPTYCISTACSSATQSIGFAAALIKAGLVDRCITGGAEALLTDASFAAWEALHVMTRTTCRPFSKDRSGMVLGEGAGILVLESKQVALARGATVLAEVAGYACNNDAGDLLRPSVEGAIACMRQTIEDASLSPSCIGYVNAHGTGTVANDVTEANALREVFGEHFDSLSISSTKPIHGHALGAAGALELIISIFALREQMAPPTINFSEIDPAIAFAPVPNVARPFTGFAALSNSFAFGGINSSLLITLPVDY